MTDLEKNEAILEKLKEINDLCIPGSDDAQQVWRNSRHIGDHYIFISGCVSSIMACMASTLFLGVLAQTCTTTVLEIIPGAKDIIAGHRQTFRALDIIDGVNGNE